jgi:hypothetical protein
MNDQISITPADQDGYRVTMGLEATIKLGSKMDFECELALADHIEEGFLFYPNRVTTNPMSPNMFLLDRLVIAGIDVQRGAQADAWEFNANRRSLADQETGPEYPVCDRTTHIYTKGAYTGLVPNPLPPDSTADYRFIVSVTGYLWRIPSSEAKPQTQDAPKEAVNT